MNGDDELDPHELDTPVEILTATTLGWVEVLRRKRICLYPGPRLPVRPGDIVTFAQCLPHLGDADALIFCAPHFSKQEARNVLEDILAGGGGGPGVTFNLDECVGTSSDLIWDEGLLFPRKSENLLLQPQPNGEPQPTRPPDEAFWAHYFILSIIGHVEKLHVLHLGLAGEHAWPYFLQPNGLVAKRVIARPP